MELNCFMMGKCCQRSILLTDVSGSFCCSGSTNGVQLMHFFIMRAWKCQHWITNIMLFSILLKTFFIFFWKCPAFVFEIYLTKYLFLRARQALGHLQNLSLSVLSSSDLKSWNKQVTWCVDLTSFLKMAQQRSSFCIHGTYLETDSCKRHSC